MAFAWAEPITKHSPLAPGDHPQKVAEVDIVTDQVVKIYVTTIDAAKRILNTQYFPFTPSIELVQEVATNIADAASCYHKKYLDSYWRWIGV